MRTILFFAALLLTLGSFAQTWFPIGAAWHYNYSENGGFFGYNKYEVIKDTVVLGKNSKVISQKTVLHDGAISFFGNFVCREENDSVYLFTGVNFQLMYDFTLNIGDSIKYIANPPVKGIDDCDSVWDAVVQSYGDWASTGLDYQRSVFNIYNLSSIKLVETIEFIRRIGQERTRGESFEEFFHPRQPSCYATFGGDEDWLRCYSDSDYTYKDIRFIGVPCDSLIQDLDISTQKLVEKRLLLSPNPTSETLTISNLEGSNNFLNIYSSTGELIKSEIISGSSFEVNVSDLPTGVYYLTVISQEGKQSSATFVKE